MISRQAKIDRMFALGQMHAKKVVKTVFGGSDDSAQKAQARANAATAEIIEENAAKARADVLALSPAGEANRNQGYQAALDVFAQTVPQQLQSLQAGNIGAQRQLLAGLPQIQNAILGTPVNFSGLQPQRVPFDAGFASQQLPEFIGIREALAAVQQEAQAQSDADLSIIASLQGPGGRLI